jgi:hypothetical protein
LASSAVAAPCIAIKTNNSVVTRSIRVALARKIGSALASKHQQPVVSSRRPAASRHWRAPHFLAAAFRHALRFTRRFSLVPGLRVALSKRCSSLSIGHRGAWCTVGPRGQRAALGLPGTGLFRTETIPPAAPPRAGRRVVFVAVVVLFVALVALGLIAVTP